MNKVFEFIIIVLTQRLKMTTHSDTTRVNKFDSKEQESFESFKNKIDEILSCIELSCIEFLGTGYCNYYVHDDLSQTCITISKHKMLFLRPSRNLCYDLFKQKIYDKLSCLSYDGLGRVFRNLRQDGLLVTVVIAHFKPRGTSIVTEKYNVIDAEPKITSPYITRVKVSNVLRGLIEENAGFVCFGNDDKITLEDMCLWKFIVSSNTLQSDNLLGRKALYHRCIERIIVYDRLLCILHLMRINPKFSIEYFEDYTDAELRYLVIKTYGYIGRCHFPIYFYLLGRKDPIINITHDHFDVFVANCSRLCPTRRTMCGGPNKNFLNLLRDFEEEVVYVNDFNVDVAPKEIRATHIDNKTFIPRLQPEDLEELRQKKERYEDILEKEN